MPMRSSVTGYGSLSFYKCGPCVDNWKFAICYAPFVGRLYVADPLNVNVL